MDNRPEFTLLQNASLALLILVLGVMAGFFWTYSFNVNYAMLEVSGEYYATMQSLFNVNVRHVMFFSFFFGGGAFGVLAVLINLKHTRHFSFWLITLATVIYILGIIVYTREVNLPLNYYTESWDPKNLPEDWQSIRDQWNQTNLIRVGTSLSAFSLAIIALLSRSLCRR